uniref:Elongation of very long chain fatty acids protein n=1 Tax=Heterorhabditis bacteriophora TaxID=37862 RepID=A0A1I7XCT9_HETBA
MSVDLILGDFEYGRAKAYCASIEGFFVKLSVAYIVIIFTIKYYMRNKKAFDLQLPLNIWNGILAVFSILGFIYTFPTFLNVAFNKGLSHTYTNISNIYTDKRAGYWVFLWVLSKIPELLDTLFIVLRKKPLMFMHWYHHALTGYYAIVNYYEDNAHMVWVVWMNYIIHSVMYSYYLLRSLKIKVPPQIAQIITTSQMVQFVAAIGAQMHVGYLFFKEDSSKYAITLRGWTIGVFMLVTYLLLWIRITPNTPEVCYLCLQEYYFRFYNISYYRQGGKKYVNHKTNDKKE